MRKILFIVLVLCVFPAFSYAAQTGTYEIYLTLTADNSGTTTAASGTSEMYMSGRSAGKLSSGNTLINVPVSATKDISYVVQFESFTHTDVIIADNLSGNTGSNSATTGVLVFKCSLIDNADAWSAASEYQYTFQLNSGTSRRQVDLTSVLPPTKYIKPEWDSGVTPIGQIRWLMRVKDN